MAEPVPQAITTIVGRARVVGSLLPLVPAILSVFSFVSSLFEIRESDGFPLEEFVPVYLNEDSSVGCEGDNANQRKSNLRPSAPTSLQETQGIFEFFFYTGKVYLSLVLLYKAVDKGA